MKRPMKHALAACAAALLLAAPAAAKPLKIGVAISRSEHLFLVKIRDAIQAHARALGDVEVQFEDAQGDVGRQLSQVQNFVAQGVDAVIVNAADTSATQGITRMMTRAGIPLVYVNLGPGLDEKLPPKVAVVVSDHVVSGRLQMEGLARCMKGKGNLAIMLGELACWANWPATPRTSAPRGTRRSSPRTPASRWSWSSRPPTSATRPLIS